MRNSGHGHVRELAARLKDKELVTVENMMVES